MNQFNTAFKQVVTKKATDSCIDIFENYTESEIKQFSPAIQNAWSAGRQLSELKEEARND